MPTLPFIIIMLAKINYKSIGQSKLLIRLAIAGFFVQLPSVIVRYGAFIRGFYEEGFARGIDYLPGFSPIIWSWISLLSLILGHLNVFPKQISISVLEGYFLYSKSIPVNKIAKFNLWFLNILEVNKNLFLIVIAVIVILCLLIIMTGRYLFKRINFNEL